MSGKARPSLRAKTLENVKRSNLSQTDKDCIQAVFKLAEKQIPKKVVRHGFDPNKLISTVSYTCPVCHTHVSESEYCSNCGQALDWSDTNER